MMHAKEERRAAVLSALLAAALLLLFSRSSPLYPTNNWGEANAFFTVGRGMLAGMAPYRDLSLSAGPVVYGLHALAALISDASFLGVWLLEIIALAASIFFAWKAANRISGMPVLSMACAALAAMLLVSSRAFVYGDTVEEFALPLQMFALCDLLGYLADPERKMSTWRLALHGFMAGCGGEYIVSPDHELIRSTDGIIISQSGSVFYAFPYDRTGTYTLPKTVTKIFGGAFYGCQLSKIIVPESVTIIDDRAFLHCADLKTIVLPKGLQEIGARAFMSTGLTEITIPYSCKTASDSFDETLTVKYFS